MRMKCSFIIALVVMVIFVGSDGLLNAQSDQQQNDHDPLWLVTVHDPLTHRLWLLNDSGEVVRENLLPVPDEYPDAIVHQVAATLDLAAYIIAYDTDPGAFADYAYQLLLYDLRLNQMIHEQPLPEHAIISALEFDRHNSFILYVLSVRPRVWEVSQLHIVMDASSVGVVERVATLTSENPVLSHYTPNIMALPAPAIPRILSTGEDRVLLALATNDEDTRVQIIDWQPWADVISIVDSIVIKPRRLGFCDNLNCSESVLIADQDARFGQVSSGAFNVMQVFLPSTNALFPVLSVSDRNLMRMFFVNNGTQVLVEGYMPSGDTLISVWEIFTPSGMSDSVQWQPDTAINSVTGTLNGFLYTTGGNLYEYINGQPLDGTARRVFEAPTDDLRILRFWEAAAKLTGAPHWTNLNDG